MEIAPQTMQNFRSTVWKYYIDHKRPMPWREDTRPYYVLVSEVMLQQTQVARVLDKFKTFINRFPDFESLAEASLAEVLQEWVGLGYNRRARYLKLCADVVVADYGGNLPSSVAELVALPGIGYATASAIMNYAFNMPVPYIETNVRTVFFHHFFQDKNSVSDKELLTVVVQCHDHENPREWCWALMDYGTHLKRDVGTLLKKSKHYSKQSKFEGSKRQKRGEIVRQLLQAPATVSYLSRCCDANDEEVCVLLMKMQEEGLVQEKEGLYYLSK